MRLQIKAARWLCLPTSFAMALDMPVADVLAEVGHDGSEIICPQLAEPNCRRGFHIQELIDVALRHGCAVTPIELFSQLAHGSDGPIRDVTFTDNWRRFADVIFDSRGVIDGLGRFCGHVVAYDHGMIFDPDGCEYPYSRARCEERGFFTRCVWRIDTIRS